MNIIIISKSPYSAKITLRNNLKNIPMVMAGHTIQLVRPFANYLLENNCKVSILFPLPFSKEDATILDPDDNIPDNVALAWYSAKRLPKSIHNSGELELNASIMKLGDDIGSVDWILFFNAFPALPLAQNGIKYIKRQSKIKTKIGVLLRGGDGYKWSDSDYVSSLFQDDSKAFYIRKFYLQCLMEADFIATASDWLKDRVNKLGLKVNLVVPSPPISLSPFTTESNKYKLSAEIKPVFGKLDPSKTWLTVIGRISPDKCPQLALKSFLYSRLDSWQCIFAGAGQFQNLKYLIDQFPMQVQQRIVGITVPPRLLSSLYGSSDGVLHTSIPNNDFTDARPSALTSAAFHGKPVVAVICGGIQECMSVDNLNTLCKKYENNTNIDVIAGSLSQCLNKLEDSNLRSIIGRSNITHCNNIGIEKILKNLFDKISMYTFN